MRARSSERLLPFRSVRHLLIAVIDLHVRTRRRYLAAARCAGDLRLVALLGYLADREAEQAEILARLCSSEDASLDCLVQGVPAADFAAAVMPTRARDDYAAVAASWLRREHALETCFERLSDMVGPRAHAVFEALSGLKRLYQERLHQAMIDS
ncbi:MAG: hypothetical protein H6835_14665 [Planctomycetes bacterium]|nr:hypothetical protein [Planctomycetota bacterium]